MKQKKGKKGKVPSAKDKPKTEKAASAPKEFYSLVPEDIEKLRIGPSGSNVYFLRVFESFNYPPLPGPDYIRLLHLKPPGSDPLELRGYLKAHKLDTNLEYEAISYAWGDHPEFNHALHINDQVLRITGNLYAALMAYSHVDRERVLWADAICINQADTAEKTQQVSIMADIYSKAKTVQVWLAPHSAANASAMKFLGALSHRTESLGVSDKVNQPRSVADLPTVNISDEDALQLIQDAIGAHVDYLLFRSWFNRVWIIQEVTLATKLVVSCGHSRLDWTTFARAIEALRGAVRQVRQGEERSRLEGIKAAWELVRLRDNFRLYDQHGVRDHHVMTNLVGRQMSNKACSDDRDRVYAMLAMTQSPYGMTPDYDKTVEEAYTEFTRRYSPNTQIYWAGLSRRKRLEKPKEQDDHTEKPQSQQPIDLTNQNYLPSWVQEFRPARNLAWASPFTGTYSTVLSTPFYFLPHPVMQNVMGVTGTILDVACPFTWRYKAGSAPHCLHEPDFFFSLITQLQNIVPETCEPEKQPYPEPLWLVLAKTLTGGVGDCAGAESILSRYPNFKALESLGKGSIAWLTAIWNNFTAQCLNPTGEIFQHILLKALGATPRPFSEGTKIANGFLCYLANILISNRLFVTTSGWMGLAAADIEPGDFVAIINGTHMPYLVRPAGKVKYKDKVMDNVVQVLGPCYVHGIMKGEIIKCKDEERFKNLKWTRHEGDKVDSLKGWLMLI